MAIFTGFSTTRYSDNRFTRNPFLRLAAVCCGAVLMAGFATAEEPAAAAPAAAKAKPEQCIPIRQIRNTRVLDDQTVLFYSTNSRGYRNQLPHRCSGLKMADSFMYRTSQSELCSLDIITVLNRMGSDFTPGPSCGLGTFEPMSAAELDELLKKK